ncbi:MAG: topoisomerase DNA-binding C4 zinc finger domain-containing protein [Desulfovibrio sp.]|nr:topoisomerase DNA-binding C4 zinc finger domain-containing protein [Desulfovibrio sp.]
MPTYYCPLCQAPLKRHARKDDAEKHFWSCTGYKDGCTFICDDCHEEPFLKTCPECGKVLARKISKKNGKPYVACFNKDEHKEGTVLFFAEDGSQRDGSEEKYPEPKGIFTCPECHGQLLYRRVRKGKFAGQKNIFLCPRKEEHKDGAVRFFEDKDGVPLL